MRQLLCCLAALALAAARIAAQPHAPYSPTSLAAELRALAGNPQARAALPPAWEVETREGRYSISTAPLKTSPEQAKVWLGTLAQHLEGFEVPVSSGARVRLDRILARREFGGVSSPSAVELLRRRISAWIRDLLLRIFGVMAAHPTTGQILFWIVVAGCVGFLAFGLIRWWNRDRRMPGLPPSARAEMPVRTWQQWLADAHHAAEEGDWRQAIHSAYWAAISRLQQSGALPEDLTYTPREYLRLFSAPAGREPLAALTSGLERFWYASRAAHAEDFRESLNHLETLGCKVE